MEKVVCHKQTEQVLFEIVITLKLKSTYLVEVCWFGGCLAI